MPAFDARVMFKAKRVTGPWALGMLTVISLTLACVPQFSPGQAPPDPVPALPVPNIEATVEALVTERVREALAAIPTVTPAPTATPVPTATPQVAHDGLPLPSSPRAGLGFSPEEAAPPLSEPAQLPTPSGLAEMVDRVKGGIVRVNTPDGVGSGIIIGKVDGEKGLVLTNYHVVADSYRIDVLVDDSRTFRARLVGFDQRRDLAVLEMCCADFPTLAFSSGADISAGSEVIAIGYALGLTGNATVTRGIVSAVRYHPGMRAWVIQTDASINPGNSGGPLLLPTGEVVGVTTFLQNQDNRGNRTAGLGFAIAERSIRELLPDMMEGFRNVVPGSDGDGTDAPPAGSLHWQTYTSRNHGYSVEVPADWGIDDSDQERTHFDSAEGFAGFTIAADRRTGSTVDAWVDAVVAEHLEFFDGRFQIVERETYAGDNEARVAHIVYRARIANRFCLLRVTELFLRTAGGDLVASFHICEHSYSKYSAVQQAVLSSIQTR